MTVCDQGWQAQSAFRMPRRGETCGIALRVWPRSLRKQHGAIAALVAALMIGNVPTAAAATQAAVASAQQAKKPPVKGETPAVVLNDEDIASIMGQQVFSSSGQSMGRVVDLLVDRKGEVRAAIIDFGGFLGVGSRKVAVDWHALHYPEKGKLDHLILSLNRDEVRVAPEYKPGEPVVVVKASASAAPIAVPKATAKPAK